MTVGGPGEGGSTVHGPRWTSLPLHSVNRIIHTNENITFSRTSYVVGRYHWVKKYKTWKYYFVLSCNYSASLNCTLNNFSPNETVDLSKCL